MEYFSKFTKRISTPRRTQPTSQQQLSRFHRCWTYIYNNTITSREQASEDKLMYLRVEDTDLGLRMQELVDVLVEENHRISEDSTGACIEYLHKNRLLNTLVHIAYQEYPKGVRGHVVKTFGSLIYLLNDNFLVHSDVHGAVVKLLRICVKRGKSTVPSSEFDKRQYDEELVDLMYAICEKIRGYPELLEIFFCSKSDKKNSRRPRNIGHLPQSSLDSSANIMLEISSSPDGQAGNSPERVTTEKETEYEFLVFTALLEFIHREGKLGDFARTGLLLIMELTDNEALAAFILESDFTSIMAATLGALYSQLPRKLLVKASTAKNEPNISLLGIIDDDADYVEDLEAIRSGGLELSSNPEFRMQLDAFFKLFEFWQDVLQRCPRQEICLALLSDLKTVFLENILYPSILECSDTDGSAVAVISYLDIILQTIVHEDLVNVVVDYLMDIEDVTDVIQTPNETDAVLMSPISRANRRRSMALRQISNEGGLKSPNYFTALGRFTLQDLIYSRLKSDSEATTIATLKLLHTLISRHCRYFLHVVKIEIDPTATSFALPSSSTVSATAHTQSNPANERHSPSRLFFTTIGHHQQELDFFSTLVTMIDPRAFDAFGARDFSTGFENYLHDAENLLKSDSCYQVGLNVECFAEEERLKCLSLNTKNRNMNDKQTERDVLNVTKIHNHISSPMPGLAMKTVPRHRIKSSDPLIKILQRLLYNYFTHSTELNLSLTGVISAMAICPFRSVESWLVQDADKEEPNLPPIKEKVPSHLHDVNDSEDDSEDEMELIETSFVAAMQPCSPSFSNQRKSGTLGETSIFEILRNLALSISKFRKEFVDFDALLEERREGLLFVENLTDALEIMDPSVANRRQGLNAEDTPSRPPTVPQNTPISLTTTSTNGTPLRAIPPWVKTPVRTGSPASPFSAHLSRTKAIKVRPLRFSAEDNEEMITIKNNMSLTADKSFESVSSTSISTTAADGDDDVFLAKSSKRLSITTDSASLSSFGTTKTLTGSQAADMAISASLNQDEVSLSSILNNVVILEETVKELVAIVQVRRSLGIDEVRFMI